MIKPTAFGYVLSVPSLSSRPSMVAPFFGRSAITRFAAREGFDVIHIFVDTSDPEPRAAFESMLEATRFTEVQALIVPSVAHLGPDRDAQAAARRRIQAQAGIPVVSVRMEQPPAAPAGALFRGDRA